MPYRLTYDDIESVFPGDWSHIELLPDGTLSLDNRAVPLSIVRYLEFRETAKIDKVVRDIVSNIRFSVLKTQSIEFFENMVIPDMTGFFPAEVTGNLTLHGAILGHIYGLVGFPRVLNGTLTAMLDKMTTLRGFPRIINGDLYVSPRRSGDQFTLQHAPLQVNSNLIIQRGVLTDFVDFPSNVNICRLNCQWRAGLDYMPMFMPRKSPNEVIHPGFNLGNPELYARFKEILNLPVPNTAKRRLYLAARAENRALRRKR